MRVFAGTSGFSIDEWQGQFYPNGLRGDERLAYYASRLPSVEINNSFYQMPKPALLERWRDTVSDGFRFALKAPRRFTHSQPLRATGDSLEHFLDALGALRKTLGPVLFQLPPTLRKDATLLSEFLSRLPATLRAAFEFRHRSWFEDDVFALLASKNAAVCGGDSDEKAYHPPFVATADFGYLRLRAASYDAASLRMWIERIQAERWTDAFVYLKHEVMGPGYAMFLDAVAGGVAEPPFPHTLPNAQAPERTQAHPTKPLAQARSRTKGDVRVATPRKKAG
jgi:uncharacterized protein YecE (DUF72 family)